MATTSRVGFGMRANASNEVMGMEPAQTKLKHGVVEKDAAGSDMGHAASNSKHVVSSHVTDDETPDESFIFIDEPELESWHAAGLK